MRDFFLFQYAVCLSMDFYFVPSYFNFLPFP